MIYQGQKYLPILFQAEMVKAILEERKTQTRRLHDKPKYKVGDRLWVRESWRPICTASNTENFLVQYFDGQEKWCFPEIIDSKNPDYGVAGYYECLGWCKWKPSIHMPFGTHRIELEVTEVRQERLKDISINDAIAEGIEKVDGRYWKNYKGTTRAIANADWSFFSLWEKIYGLESFNSNPLVYAYTFKLISK